MVCFQREFPMMEIPFEQQGATVRCHSVAKESMGLARCQAAFSTVTASYGDMQVENDVTLLSWSKDDSTTALNAAHSTLRDNMAATILLIDDNAVQAATRQTILKRAGYFVIAALSPEWALEQFRHHEFPRPVDLILTDHLMPGMNGSEFITRLREFELNVPVLVISGMAEAEEAYKGLNVHFRLKPLLPDHLLASVHDLVHSKV
jgi:CheY-like chemotaxis protein